MKDETIGTAPTRFLRRLRRISIWGIGSLSLVLIVSACSRTDSDEEFVTPTLAPEFVIVTPTPLPPGATVVIPPTPTVDIASLPKHTVGEGETLSSIADQYGITPERLQEVNGIEDPNSLQAGQELAIPSR